VEKLQLVEIGFSNDYRIPKNQPVNVLMLRSGYQRQSSTKPKPDQTNLCGVAAVMDFAERSCDVRKPLMNSSLFRIAVGITASIEVKAQDRKACLREKPG
jgi:hypothetical protein